MKNIFLVSLLTLLSFSLFSQNKKKLDHTLYPQWERLSDAKISNNGEFISYEINPTRGDGSLFLYKNSGEKLKEFPLGDKGRFSADNALFIFQVKTPFDTVRQLKLDKVKKDDMPKDSLFLYYLAADTLQKVPNVVSWKIPKKNGGWAAWISTIEIEEEVENDSIVSDSLDIEIAEKPDTKENEILNLLNTISREIRTFEDVESYHFSKNGELFAFNQKFGDSIDSTQVFVFDTEESHLKSILNCAGESSKLALDDSGNQLAFLFSPDTTEVKVQKLMYWNSDNNRTFEQAVVAVDSSRKVFPENWAPSENYNPVFTENGNILYFGISEIPPEKPEDSLLKKEKAVVDIWSWKDDFLQPQQLLNAEQEKKRTYRTAYFVDKDRVVLLASPELENVRNLKKGNEIFSIASDNRAYRPLTSWDGWYSDYYLINHKNGEKHKILEKFGGYVSLSPDAKYLSWFDANDSCWWGMSVKEKVKHNLTNTLDVLFYDEEHDTPALPGSYGIAGWTKSGNVIVYDCFDLWQFGPTGKENPICLTNGFGRENSIRFRYAKVDREADFIPLKTPIFLSSFNRKNKESGYFEIEIDNKSTSPKELVMLPKQINGLKKAEDSDVIIWRNGDFQNYPELYSGSLDFSISKKLSTTNSQQKDYNWGTVELINWTNFEGDNREGLLYKPENFDSTKKYPVLVYFYSRNSDNLHRHNSLAPTRSTINVPLYISNGYIVFIPNIRYKTGHPGKCAYSDIVSGAMKLGNEKWIDEKHMGIQGQSWGGYQVSYLVTQTNLFAAAEAGAPVSNMVSAYGGIRWGSGMSRMFQYEKTQSRIGGTLWEKPMLYFENSPIFFAENVETPLMIMHNDNDGAVPWYQGIEFFVALRRLNKPVWLLNYNGDSHNLKEDSWGNRVDLSIRMMQFFDHYLKNSPAPKWMTDGVPAIEKGEKNGLDLLK